MKKLFLPLLMLATAFTMSAFDAENLYVVGSGCAAGWSPDNALEMTKVENNVFTWNGELKSSGEFKFIVARDWHPSITCNFETENQQNTTVDSGTEYNLYVRPDGETGQDNKFQVAVTGIYTVNVDLNDMKMVATLEEEVEEPLEIFIVGSATKGGWDLNNAMNQPLTRLEDGTYTWSGELKEGNFRFIFSPNWYPTYTTAKDENELVEAGTFTIQYDETGREGEPSFLVETPGLFNINLNLDNLTMILTERAPELYIIGNALNGGSDLWDLGWASPFTPTGNANEFVWNGYLYKLGYSNDNPEQTRTAEFRFICQSNDWNPGFVAEYVQDQISVGGTYNFLPAEGNPDMKYTVEKDGWYKLIANTSTLTLEVLEGSPEGDGVAAVESDNAVVSLHGNVFTVAGGVADVYDIQGRVIAKAVSNVTLPAGVYVAVANGNAHKLIVR